MDLYTGERRGDLLRLDLPHVRARVRTVLSSFPSVAGAYLFGSALEFVRSNSDIDLGLIVRPIREIGSIESLAGEVEARLGKYGSHPFQVSVLRQEDNSFAFRAMRDGEIVSAADLEYVTDFIERVSREHEDLAPFRRTFYAALGMGI